MKKTSFILFCLSLITFVLPAQSKSGSTQVPEGQVPEAVKKDFNDNYGYLVEKWLKITLNNAQIRYVAVYQMMNPSSAKTLQNRIRYTENGKITSSSEYRGNGTDGEDISVYLGTGGVEEAFLTKFKQTLKENTLVSFEGFKFVPANQTELISAHRLVLKDKKKRKVIIYYDGEGKEIDMKKYPVRFMEAAEMD